jgi:hypothetical protein
VELVGSSRNAGLKSRVPKFAPKIVTSDEALCGKICDGFTAVTVGKLYENRKVAVVRTPSSLPSATHFTVLFKPQPLGTEHSTEVSETHVLLMHRVSPILMTGVVS